MALPKKNRISDKKEIDWVFKKGRTVRGSFLFIRFADNKMSYPRFAFTVSAKNVPLAVQRNRIRRVLAEVVIEDPQLLKSGYDIFVSVSRRINKNQIRQLVEEFRTVLKTLQTQ